MKSEDLQKVVALKHQNGDYRTKIFPDLNGVLGLTTIKRWCKMIDETGFINLTTSPGPLRTIRTEDAIKKVFDIDGVYHAKNDRVWTVNRDEADKKGGIHQKKAFPQKVMVWLGVCSKGVSSLVIFDQGTYGNHVFGNDWTFRQDGAKPHVHQLTQQWCHDNFPGFIDKDHWPPNSSDLNPLDYCIWDEIIKFIDCNRATSKATMIQELTHSVKKIRQNVMFESCNSWTNRLYRMSKNE
ncbi:unnamed protein product [Rotaria sp. Silwood2]|nr:unnamed protein product [Rotaria sp. Silwood2]CAF4493050.1 unnamed protein product [Rotaria sp. Silwood2]